MATHSSAAAAAAYSQPPLSPNPDQLVVAPQLVTPAATGVNQKLFELLGELAALDTALVMGDIAKAAGFRLNDTGKLTYDAALIDLEIATYHLMFRCPYVEKRARLTPSVSDEIFFKEDPATRLFQADASDPSRYFITIDGKRHDIKPFQRHDFSLAGLRLFMDPEKGSFLYFPYSSYYGDPLSSAATFGPYAAKKQSWSYRANELRKAAGLRRLNAAGDEVDATGRPEIDFATEAGYDKLGIVFSGTYATLKSAEGLFETTGASDAERAHKRVLFSTFLVAMEENPRFPDSFWRKNARPHFPAEASPRTEERRDLTLTPTPTRAVSEQDILQDASGKAYAWEDALEVASATAGTSPTLSFSAAHGYAVGDNLEVIAGGSSLGVFPVASSAATQLGLKNTPEKVTWAGAQVKRKIALAVKCGDGTALKGRRLKKDAKGYYIETGLPVAAVMSNASGLTMGMGLDLGAGFNAGITYSFTFEITGATVPAGTFTLYYGNDEIADIPFAATAEQFAEKLKSSGDLALVLDTDTKAVTKTGNRWTFSFKNRTFTKNKSSDSIYVQRFSCTHASIRIAANPDETEDTGDTPYTRDWRVFEQIMNYSHAYGATGDTWLASVPVDQREAFKRVTKKCFGVQKDGAWVLWQRNKALIDQFAIPDWVKHLRAVQELRLKPSYHDRAYAGVQPLLKAAMNELERYVMSSITWNHEGSFIGKGSLARRVRDFFALGINSHNPVYLLKAVELCKAISSRKEGISHRLKPFPVKVSPTLNPADLNDKNRKVTFSSRKLQLKVGTVTYTVEWADPAYKATVDANTTLRLYAYRDAFFLAVKPGVELDLSKLLAYYRHHP